MGIESLTKLNEKSAHTHGQKLHEGPNKTPKNTVASWVSNYLISALVCPASKTEQIIKPIYSKTPEPKELLQQALENDDASIIRDFPSTGMHLIYGEDKTLNPPVPLAVKYKKHNVLKALLEKGASWDQKMPFMYNDTATAIEIASITSNKEALVILEPYFSAEVSPFLDQITIEISTIQYTKQEKRERIKKLSAILLEATDVAGRKLDRINLDTSEGKYKAIEQKSLALYHFLQYGTPIKNLDQNNPQEPSL